MTKLYLHIALLVVVISSIQASAYEVSTDRCFEEKDPGPCRGSFPRYYYDAGVGSCRPFTYGGCGGNENRFTSLGECSRECTYAIRRICGLPAVPGPCKAAIPRYFFNSYTRRCEKFTYGGCRGNENRFEKLEDCQLFCRPRYGLY